MVNVLMKEPTTSLYGECVSKMDIKIYWPHLKTIQTEQKMVVSSYSAAGKPCVVFS